MAIYWFIDNSHLARYAEAVGAQTLLPPDPEKIAEIRANADKWASAGYTSENLEIVGSEAHINISGVLLASANVIDEYYAKYFGETYATYGGIITQIKAAEQDTRVEKIVLNICSPGGHVQGCDEAAQAIVSASKPTEARVGWMAASSGYYLASQADRIVATSPAASVGCIGTALDLVDASELYSKMGVKFYSLASTDAPEKRKEAHSPEHREQLIKTLNAYHEVFATRVAEGRSRATGNDVTKDQVNSNFGRGDMVFSAEALELGMIDEIKGATSASKPVNTKEAHMATEESTATGKQIESAKAEGVQTERARVAALLPWMAADQSRVIEAIGSGEEMTPALMSELSQKVAAQVKADAEASAKATATASVAAAAEAREADAAPVITTDEGGEVEASATEQDEDALLKQAQSFSKK